MDEKNFNVKKTLYMKSKSPRISMDNKSNSFDIDIDGKEITNTKLEYRNKLVANLQNERKKMSNDMDNCDKRPKYSRHTISIKNEVVQNIKTQLINPDSPDLSKSKTNYKTICDEIDSKPAKDSLLIANKLNTSGFLSLSRQSLNDSANAGGISNTASRISGNFLNRNIAHNEPIVATEPAPPQTLPSKSYAFRNRRFRTVVKQDRFSSYLTRVASKDDNIFSIPPSQTANKTAPLNINLSETSSSLSEKRIDFSKILQFQRDKPTVVNDKTDSNSDIHWNCSNCDSSNPSNFNFCPTCSAANPKLTSFAAKKRSFSSINESQTNDWICSRCSTKNDDIRPVCVFCFRSKDELSTKKRKLVVESDQSTKWSCPSCLVENSADVQSCPCCHTAKNSSGINSLTRKWTCNSCLVENDADRDSCACCTSRNPSAKKIDAPQSSLKCGIIDSSVGNIKFGTNATTLKPSSKWSCGTCLVENDADRDSCVCCTSRNPSAKETNRTSSQPIMFGNSDSSTGTIKFGTQNDNDNAKKSIDSSGNTIASLKPLSKWACGTCLVENDADRDCCACCNAKNPSAKQTNRETSAQPMFNFGNNVSSMATFKFGNSESSSGPIKFGNSESSSGSIKFGNSESSSGSIKFGTQKEEKSIFQSVSNDSSGNKDENLKPLPKWTCNTCLVENDADRDCCVCCNAKNPSAKDTKDTSSQPMFNLPNNVSSNATFKFGNNESSSGSIAFGTPKEDNDTQKLIFKSVSNDSSGNTIANRKPLSKWACNTCLVENDADRDCCVCCNAKNPAAKETNTNVIKPMFNLGNNVSSSTDNIFIFGMPNKPTETGPKWTCPGCWVTNTGTAEKCPCCSVGKPVTNSSDSTTKLSINSSSNNLQISKINVPNNADSLQYTFSAPESLGVSACSDVPVDLVFEFSDPLSL